MDATDPASQPPAFGQIIQVRRRRRKSRKGYSRMTVMAYTATIWLVTGIIILLAVTGWGWRSIATERSSHDAAVAEANAKSWPTSKQRRQLASATAYNKTMASSKQPTLGHEDDPGGTGYAGLLDTGSGIMARITIPKINVDLPVYHTVTTQALDKGVGHMPDSSLPVGGTSTRPILSAHNGLTGAKYFDDLDKLRQGDLITIHVLNHELGYRVTRIETVRPDEVRRFAIIPGQDLLTLTTCTNGTTSRLAVTARRTPLPGHRSRTPEQWTGVPEGLLAAIVTMWLLSGPVMLHKYGRLTMQARHRKYAR